SARLVPSSCGRASRRSRLASRSCANQCEIDDGSQCEIDDGSPIKTRRELPGASCEGRQETLPGPRMEAENRTSMFYYRKLTRTNSMNVTPVSGASFDACSVCSKGSLQGSGQRKG